MTDESPIRYVAGSASNAVLRKALADIANQQCYFCTEPKAFFELQIDHLIARSTSAPVFAAKAQERKPGGYHVDDPENLGVICSRCNGLKSDRDQTNNLQFIVFLDRAVERADEVRARVRSLRSGRGLATQLVRASTADLGDAGIRNTFLEVAPSIVQQLATLGEEHIRYLVADSALGVDEGVPYDLRVILDARLRYVRDLISNLFGIALLDLLRAAGAVAWDELSEAARRKVARGPDARYEAALDVGAPDALHLEFALDEGEAMRSQDLLHLTFRGSVDGWLNAHAAGDDHSTMTGFRDSMVDVWVYGSIQLTVEIPIDEEVDLNALEFEVELGGVDLELDWEG